MGRFCVEANRILALLPLHRTTGHKPHSLRRLNADSERLTDPVLTGREAFSVTLTRRVFFLYSISSLPALAVEEGIPYRDEKGRYMLTIPSDWKQKNKAGADSYFYNSRSPRTNVGVTVNPVRSSTTQSFGSLVEIRDRLLNAERQKDGFLDLEFIEECALETELGSDFNIYAYKLNSTRGTKAIVTGVVIADYQLFIVNGTCRCEKDANDCGTNDEFRELQTCVQSFKLM